MRKRLIAVGIILVMVVVLVSLIGTFASDSTVATNDNTYDITLTGSTGEISVPAGSSKTAIYQITNTNKGVVKYGVAYSGDNITVKVYNDTIDAETGFMDYGENKFVKLYIENGGTTDSIASIQAVLGYEHGGELTPIVPSGYTLVTEVYSPPKGLTIVSLVTNLYASATKTTATNNGITYNYASELGLMNDRLGTMDVGADEGNIRYYGANPNNYIYFNCEKYPETNCELWRIIGIIDGKVKIARATVLDSDMQWNSAGTNNWNTASLKTYLNGDYYAGLKNDATRGLISYSTWYLGGYSTSSGLYANDIYEYERKNEVGTTILSGNPPSIEANIGLMYASDYSYATDLSVCTKDIYNYDGDKTNCGEKDWLLKSGTTNTSQWTITPNSGNSGNAWSALVYGYVGSSGNVYVTGGVRPVLYLKSELGVDAEHAGTSTDPYRIVID